MNQMLACTIWLLHYTEMRMVGFEVGYTGKYPVGQYTNLHSFVDVKYKSNLVQCLANRASQSCTDDYTNSELVFISKTPTHKTLDYDILDCPVGGYHQISRY